MDELGGFEPTDTSGFIQIESIRIKKFVTFDIAPALPPSLMYPDPLPPFRWGQANVRNGHGGVAAKEVYGSHT